MKLSRKESISNIAFCFLEQTDDCFKFKVACVIAYFINLLLYLTQGESSHLYIPLNTNIGRKARQPLTKTR